ncbi:PQQ-dependent sugar dehydrogenase [Pedosphaera parvula]|uniref:Protein up-regulated by thyroid hormone-putative PQQ-dependent glucose dehydrogenase n=1 Tax=Pedosphaera parvula (strain Ellin514) TaxID=320771 RepID=B9XMQ2_PEDPL|nr:PQQ-dependent sugar dehydrogenase [Pedosphaera parvula]EEF58827.1 protein up-regulated by thyroid hormone-putative PQQ-dependent glucose dehydrogenase [Pedosphaera parvula Ellin514]
MRKALILNRFTFFPVLSLFCLLTFSALRSPAADELAAMQLKVAFPNLTFNRPLWLEEAPDDSKRMFVVEQFGRILSFSKDTQCKDTNVFLDITERKPHENNEEGLLGFAFHPDFKQNHKFYVYYSQQNPKRSVLSEFTVSATDPQKADLASERIIMQTPMVYGNHNGGTILFGRDGYLYISVGDGGLGGDPHNFGQSTRFLYGKILRIDVNSRTGSLQYGIPNDNPFVGKSDKGLRGEVYACGLRNPWRMSFDRETGELWVGDVGQDKFEEIDLIVKGGNYGWSVREGFHPFKEPVDRLKDQSTRLIDPIMEYAHTPALQKECKFPDHSIGLSITGGYVYHGKKLPGLQGVYLYADFVQGTVWGLKYEHGQITADSQLTKPNLARSIASFGEDRDGEVYLLAFDGKIYELEAAPKQTAQAN